MRNLLLAFDWHYIEQKVRWRFRKILWPSQNIWTLQSACKVEIRNKVVKYECLIMFYRAKQIVYAVPSFKAKWTSINNKSLPEPYADPFYKDEREKKKICIWFSPKRKLKNATSKPTKLFSFYFLQLLWHLARQYTKALERLLGWI